MLIFFVLKLRQKYKKILVYQISRIIIFKLFSLNGNNLLHKKKRTPQSTLIHSLYTEYYFSS